METASVLTDEPDEILSKSINCAHANIKTANSVYMDAKDCDEGDKIIGVHSHICQRYP